MKPRKMSMPRLQGLQLTTLLCLGLGACAGQVPQPTDASLNAARVRWPGVALDELSEGRQLFVARCGSCHTLPIPADTTAARWPEVMRQMAPLAKLTDPEAQAVERYLISTVEAK